MTQTPQTDAIVSQDSYWGSEFCDEKQMIEHARRQEVELNRLRFCPQIKYDKNTDDMWLTFHTPNGESAMVNFNVLIEGRGPIVRKNLNAFKAFHKNLIALREGTHD